MIRLGVIQNMLQGKKKEKFKIKIPLNMNLSKIKTKQIIYKLGDN